jgi:AcrR family transcriptional regulator
VVATIESVGYRHSAEEIVGAAAAVALEHGMAGLTYRRVAERLGISDRMVVYYLPTKADLVQAAAGTLSASLQHLLEQAFGNERQDPEELVRAAWPVLATPEADRVFGIFFEVVGLAASRTEPYGQLAPALVTAWLDWLTDRTAGSTPTVRRRRALGVIARIDGLLLVRQTMGPAAATEAARALGILR